MDRTYLTALIESLEKKNKVLDNIIQKNEEQAALLKSDDFSFDAFDKNVEEKSILIFSLNKLDDGFESLFKRVSDELKENKASYKTEIATMQDLIRKITDKSASIQASEARNKAALEGIFRKEKNKIKQSRSSIKAVKSYTKAMNYKN